ncbi:hypothetical protein AQI95_32955 [Streptomyces yokosukanensis]|uniref:Lipoprotein n=1 Tax=Streptomyces yokosukanensis TaxID=67386 RepID=A0A101NXU4_9ACTN|nr:hypothetical protein [Streptomyces yokosukanensis]KUN01088.1 hypothetical protein AQI95_32955 [Streptomyces yokosukanensis]
MRCALSLAAVAALLCAGCAATDGSAGEAKPKAASSAPAPGAAVRAAVARTGTGTARLRERIEITGAGQTYALTVAGGFDFGHDRGSLAVDFPDGGISHIDETFANGKVYVRGIANLDDQAWGVVPRDRTQAHYALRAPANDPEHVLRQISAMRRVSVEGEESVHGVRAVHYRGMLDHKTLTLRMADEVRSKMDQARDILGYDLPVFADAWVDGRGRLVQIRTTLNLAAGGVKVTMGLSKLGAPVPVKTPRPAVTVPLTGMSGVLSG